jgi:hypothetical protein
LASGEEKTSLRTFILGLGAIWFAYGGHSTFPTTQQDMREPKHFGRAVVYAYFGRLSFVCRSENAMHVITIFNLVSDLRVFEGQQTA